MIAWQDVFGEDFSEDASKFTDIVLTYSKHHIPFRKHCFRKSLHSWLTDTAFEAIQAKVAASGTCSYDDAANAFSQVLAKEYAAHAIRLRTTLASLPRGSKRWWKLNRELLNRQSRIASIPPLKKDEQWMHTPQDKANSLMDSFANKCTLPIQQGHTEVEAPRNVLPSFLLIRRRWILKLLKTCAVDKATGPDTLPARILRECANEFATPICLLACGMLKHGVWPDSWRLHWVHPLYKRKAAHDANNYRGAHLTHIVAKLIEQTISMVFIPFLDKTCAFGKSQWACRRGHSCQVLVTMKMCTWIRHVNGKHRVGLLLTHIKGAFDKVDSDILAMKCVRARLGDDVCNLLKAWLAPRTARVIVQGAHSTSGLPRHSVGATTMEHTFCRCFKICKCQWFHRD